MAGFGILSSIALSLCIFHIAAASDPELLSDFAVPAGMNASLINGDFFTFTGFRGGVNPPAGKFKPILAFVNAFPALQGLGVSMALLEFQPNSINPPHTHPRGTELLYVIDGALNVGFVDTTNKLYTQKLQKGDVFVFPEGLIHFQQNYNSYEKAQALAAFSSASPGLVSTPVTLFGSGISSDVLEKAFQLDSSTLENLESPFQMNSN
eukprot:c25241_g1_i1 orf=458-1081(+)